MTKSKERVMGLANRSQTSNDYKSCQEDFGVENWSGVESNFGVANVFVLFIKCNRTYEQVKNE